MRTAKETLDLQFLEMRWRCLSLAADMDRVQNAPGGPEILASDLRIKELQMALSLLTQPGVNRAEQVQMLFSDKTS